MQGRCVAALLNSQHPHGLSDVGDLIQSTEIYDCFEGNAIEGLIFSSYMHLMSLNCYLVEYMLDYITSHEMSVASFMMISNLR